MSQKCAADGCRRASVGKLDKCKIHDNTLTKLLVEERVLLDFLQE